MRFVHIRALFTGSSSSDLMSVPTETVIDDGLIQASFWHQVSRVTLKMYMSFSMDSR